MSRTRINFLSAFILISILLTSFTISVTGLETDSSTESVTTILQKDLETGLIKEIQLPDSQNITETVANSYISDNNIDKNPKNDDILNNKFRSIIGGDGRNVVNSPDSRIAFIRVTWPNGDITTGTAWIFADKALMTAGHCVYDNERGGAAKIVAIYPGYDETKNNGNPYYANRVTWANYDWRIDDWGIIQVPNSLEEACGYLGFISSVSENEYATLQGYHGDKSIRRQYSQSGNLIKSINGKTISHLFDTAPGSSGSPVYFEEDGHRYAFGIHVQESPNVNYARKIDSTLYNLMYTYRLNPDKIFYKINYNSNGGTGSMSQSTIEYNVGSRLKANTFTKYGSQFAGWTAHRKSDNKWYYKDPNSSSEGWYVSGNQPKGWVKSIYADQTFVANTTSVNDDIVTMYAQWKPSTYTVQYNANGGTGSMADTKVTYGVGTALRANAFTKYGSQFVGWTAYRKADNSWFYKDPNSSSTGWYVTGNQPSGWVKDIYDDKTVVSKTSGYHNDVVTMYAQWKPSTYTVKYHANGGTGSMADTKVTYGVGTALRANAFTKYGSQFAGWTAYRKADNSWFYKDPNSSSTGWYVTGSQPSGWVKDIYADKTVASKTSGYHNDVVTMYAQWKPSTYTIKYHANGGTGSMDDTKVTYGVGTALRENTFTKNGSVFVGWTAYRKADNSWFYKDPNSSSAGWYVTGSQPSGWVKDIYDDKTVVSKTSGYHNDIVTMYAQWTEK